MAVFCLFVCVFWFCFFVFVLCLIYVIVCLFFFYLFCERNCLIIAFYGNTMHHQYNNIDHGSYKFLYFCLPHHICDFPSSNWVLPLLFSSLPLLYHLITEFSFRLELYTFFLTQLSYFSDSRDSISQHI